MRRAINGPDTSASEFRIDAVTTLELGADHRANPEPPMILESSTAKAPEASVGRAVRRFR
jgi:hypothetical protein